MMGLERWRRGLFVTATLVALGAGLGGCDRAQDGRGNGTQPVTDKTDPAIERSSWDGARIYDEVCDRCHKMGVDGAPEPGDTDAWRPRIEQGRDVLLQHVREGYRQMPARGDCEFCTDDQLAAALDWMLARSR